MFWISVLANDSHLRLRTVTWRCQKLLALDLSRALASQKDYHCWARYKFEKKYDICIVLKIYFRNNFHLVGSHGPRDLPLTSAIDTVIITELWRRWSQIFCYLNRLVELFSSLSSARCMDCRVGTFSELPVSITLRHTYRERLYAK